MTDRATADSRLERLLYILPRAANPDGVLLDDLADALGVEPSVLLRDLEEATARAYYHPAGSVDQFEIVIEGDRVRVWSPSEFQRPVRLSAQETLALGLGLRTLAAEAEEPRRAEILALAARLEKELAAPAKDAPGAVVDRLTPYLREAWPGAEPTKRPPSPGDDEITASYGIELGDDGFRGAVADAAQLRRRCRITYLKPGDTAPQERLIEPYALICGASTWYVLAHDTGRDAIRSFRMDRILEASITGESFEPPENFDAADYLGTGGTPYRPDEPEQALIRYSPHVARWIAESLARGTETDGSILVHHDVADPRWVVRHVLQYGGEAELLEPANLRELVRSAARKVADRAA
ncbi:MAG: helix-turn-helix transcriptional regulator [Longimicrobiales bacterium]